MIESISAITLATHDMARAVRFYRMLGFEVIYGGDDAAFTRCCASDLGGLHHRYASA
jgi:catechol 2,3-dioxygenase-like lactoylglutathione lyase family enzyme